VSRRDGLLCASPAGAADLDLPRGEKLWNNSVPLSESAALIDSEGYRANVGIILSNRLGRVLWARRVGMNAWQFPQGGIRRNESPESAMYRELREELGLEPADVRLLASTRDWLRYRLPERYIRHGLDPLCIGQKQIWYMLRMLSEDAKVNLGASGRPEFDDWIWVDYWRPLNEVVAFKREVYRRVLEEFAPLLWPWAGGHSLTG
jgi:putative (di)nucleoside polyphosphate hydrolase